MAGQDTNSQWSANFLVYFCLCLHSSASLPILLAKTRIFVVSEKCYFFLVCLFWFQNILELKVCDEDRITQDDHLLTVFFDVSKIQLGENIQLSFQLNPQVWIKFKEENKEMWSGGNVVISSFLSQVPSYICLSHWPFHHLIMFICFRDW